MTEVHHPADDEEFNEHLSTLLQHAYDNDVPVEGGWKCTIEGDGDSHWDVQITSVEYDD